VSNLFIFFTALVVSVALIPLMIRLAPRLGMVDQPDPRKVHTTPIPRVGGVGIVIGSLIPILLWVPLNDDMLAYLFGALVLLVFGLWDDSRELGHYVKFIGQFIAVLAVVYYGDVYVRNLPFMGLEPLSASIGKPFTVIAIVGMINAINHSDGLDGLAGGLSILSLSCIAYLAYLANDTTVVTISFATLGGVLGFLRYNTHPAKVFMGDGGSQFLGFTLAFLAVVLTQNANPALSPALPALILGLPIVDILAVFAQRIYHRMNWFRATKNHIHHRLLEIGFHHYEAVVIIYTIQTLFVVSAVLLSYESDTLIIALYLSVCSLIFILLYIASRISWRVPREHATSGMPGVVHSLKISPLMTKWPLGLVTLAIPLLFLTTSLATNSVSYDLGIGATVLAVILLVALIIRLAKDSFALRAVAYVTSAFIVYLESRFIDAQIPFMNEVDVVYFVVLAVAIALAVKLSDTDEFRTNPMDYLVIFIVLSAGILSKNMPLQDNVGFMVIKLVILFYGCELIISRTRSRLNPLNLSGLTALVILGLRGLAHAF
jgi:UDP-GlcNAc:undecaprenyl-phosphate GlcNAc-1-phosphate transferase